MKQKKGRADRDKQGAQAATGARDPRLFREKLDQEIGPLAAELLLEFFVRELGPSIYNQAVKDAQAFVQDKVMDLDGVLFQPEEPRSR